MATPVINKEAIVQAMAQGAGLKKADASAALNAFLDFVRAQLAAGSTVQLTAVGRLKATMAGARTARNPRTGESVDVPAQLRFSFVASDELKKAAEAAA